MISRHVKWSTRSLVDNQLEPSGWLLSGRHKVYLSGRHTNSQDNQLVHIYFFISKDLLSSRHGINASDAPPPLLMRPAANRTASFSGSARTEGWVTWRPAFAAWGIFDLITFATVVRVLNLHSYFPVRTLDSLLYSIFHQVGIKLISLFIKTFMPARRFTIICKR